jgi:hypothetical protein
MDSHSRTSGSTAEPDEGSPGVSDALARARASAPGRTVAGGPFSHRIPLGCPLEACLLDPLAAAKDPRFQGAAGIIVCDPLLAEAVRSGSMPRSSIDRYLVVVMAGIAVRGGAGQSCGGRPRGRGGAHPPADLA